MTSSPRAYNREAQPCLRGWGDFLGPARQAGINKAEPELGGERKGAQLEGGHKGG